MTDELRELLTSVQRVGVRRTVQRADRDGGTAAAVRAALLLRAAQDDPEAWAQYPTGVRLVREWLQRGRVTV